VRGYGAALAPVRASKRARVEAKGGRAGLRAAVALRSASPVGSRGAVGLSWWACGQPWRSVGRGAPFEPSVGSTGAGTIIIRGPRRPRSAEIPNRLYRSGTAVIPDHPTAAGLRSTPPASPRQRQGPHSGPLTAAGSSDGAFSTYPRTTGWAGNCGARPHDGMVLTRSWLHGRCRRGESPTQALHFAPSPDTGRTDTVAGAPKPSRGRPRR
jgi:hypothetical protein